ncbi:unnamed protein product [Gongylonema pulchrum]|uniref:PLCXc domain-containing protein n=1 Tax=Gongylonema pulchrum TaxID=637853 RepID=A0A183EVL2_9BILA|nr:unnamed protein product [Gongylonema pulchrum]
MVHNGYGSSKITLTEALNAINEAAFERTRYPLFIRLELHLDIEWQLVLVNLLCEVFGNKLYRPRSDPVDWVNGQRRPTPKDFQMRIILVVSLLLSYESAM